ncbi:MAG TPA: hypothetical protein VFW17_01590 [Ktedonobacterales bacterium]|nr:hypothetical protein [Ktedonobacterales bacterium]
MGTQWAVLVAAFLASAVEFVEAFTIVLVVGITINWRSAFAGTAAAALALVALVGVFGTALVRTVPLEALRFAVGVLLVLFGLKWLKKAILRFAGLKAMHDEEAIYEEQLAEMRARGEHHQQRIDPFGVVTSFKSVLLEGLEVAFIVITFGSAADSIGSAIWGALAAGVLVVLVGALVRSPLQRVPENTLKFIVGIMLTSFGAFWGGEGIGIQWWHEDLFLPILVVFNLVVTGLLILWLRQYAPAKHAEVAASEPAAGEALS